MAATFNLRPSGTGSVHPEKVPGSFLDAIVEVTADASYPALGYPFGLAQLSALFGGAYSAIESVDVIQHWSAPGTAAFLAVWDEDHNTIRGYGMNAAAGVNGSFTEIGTGNAALSGLECGLRVRFY
jgi:hypothetical protein